MSENTHNENKAYAVLYNRDLDLYSDLAIKIDAALKEKLSEITEKSIKEVSASLIYTLTGSRFERVISQIILEALSQDRGLITDEQVTKAINDSNHIKSQLYSIKRNAEEVQKLMNDITMQGNPQSIRILCDFINNLAKREQSWPH